MLIVITKFYKSNVVINLHRCQDVASHSLGNAVLHRPFGLPLIGGANRVVGYIHIEIILLLLFFFLSMSHLDVLTPYADDTNVCDVTPIPLFFVCAKKRHKNNNKS